MKYLNSQTLGAVGWISVFGLSWLLLLNLVSVTGLSITLFIFFFGVGLFASTYHAAQKDKMHKLYDKLYERQLDLTESKQSEGEE